MYFKCTNIGVVHVFKKRRRSRSCHISGQSLPWLLKIFSGLIRWRTYLSFKKIRKRFQAFLRKWEHRSSHFLPWFARFTSVILVVRAGARILTHCINQRPNILFLNIGMLSIMTPSVCFLLMINIYNLIYLIFYETDL